MVDLHTHSTFSDGTDSPEEIIEKAEKIGLKAVALCDHNTIKGLNSFVNAANNSTVYAVPSIEITTQYNDTELHILGMFIKDSAHERINKKLDDFTKTKVQSNKDLVKRLNERGYDIDYFHIESLYPDTFINRMHIAVELTNKGYTDSPKEAFSTLLNPKLGLYVPVKRFDALEIISFLRSVAAVPVLAHPLLSMTADKLSVFLGEAKESGLCGIETRYSLFSDEECAYLDKVAEDYSLMKSGGSDYHAKNKPDISLGSGKGNLLVPDEYFDILSEFAGRIV